MSYDKYIHKGKFIKDYMNSLKKGDILFTTTPGSLSTVIRNVANIPISHVNLYTKPGFVIENTTGVKESDIHGELQSSKCDQMIAYRNVNINDNTRDKIVTAAYKYKKRNWDGEQGLFHLMMTAPNAPFPFTMILDLIPKLKTAKLATKRAIVGALTGADANNRRKPLMCSTLAVYSYLDAGVKINMTNVVFAGTDDLFNYCKNSKVFKQLFNIKFTFSHIEKVKT